MFSSLKKVISEVILRKFKYVRNTYKGKYPRLFNESMILQIGRDICPYLYD